MMVVRCTACGREQTWKSGTSLGTEEISLGEFAVVCSCGHCVHEADGTLREGQMPFKGEKRSREEE